MDGDTYCKALWDIESKEAHRYYYIDLFVPAIMNTDAVYDRIKELGIEGLQARDAVIALYKYGAPYPTLDEVLTAINKLQI